MLQRIICVVDFSRTSEKVIEWSVYFARKLNLPLTILYAYRLNASRSGEEIEFRNKTQGDANTNFALLEKKYLLNQGISYEFKSEVGFLADRIKDNVSKAKTPLVVLGKNTESLADLMNVLNTPFITVA